MNDETLDRPVTAVTLLDTTVALTVQTCRLVARTGDRGKLLRHADHAANCIARPRQTRALARDLMHVAARSARRRLGRDDGTDPREYVDALRLVGEFEQRVCSHFAA
jgi:hypothetical protein